MRASPVPSAKRTRYTVLNVPPRSGSRPPRHRTERGSSPRPHRTVSSCTPCSPCVRARVRIDHRSQRHPFHCRQEFSARKQPLCGHGSPRVGTSRKIPPPSSARERYPSGPSGARRRNQPRITLNRSKWPTGSFPAILAPAELLRCSRQRPMPRTPPPGARGTRPSSSHRRPAPHRPGCRPIASEQPQRPIATRRTTTTQGGNPAASPAVRARVPRWDAAPRLGDGSLQVSALSAPACGSSPGAL